MSEPRCRYCAALLPKGTGRNGLPRYYCTPSHRTMDWLRRMRKTPHRRRLPRGWDVIDATAIPREYLVLSAARIERALREGRDVPGIRKKES